MDPSHAPTQRHHHPNHHQPSTAEIDAVLKLRKRLQKEYEAAFSVNDVIIRSAALALRDVPEVRSVPSCCRCFYGWVWLIDASSLLLSLSLSLLLCGLVGWLTKGCLSPSVCTCVRACSPCCSS
jgi:hypothetical protein